MMVNVNGIRMRYVVEGPPGAPVVTFSHSLATRLEVWEPQVRALAGRYRLLRYDTRGHGGTDTAPGPYSLSGLAEDVRGLLGALAISSTYFVGLSMGGMIGQTLALAHPELIQGLVLCSTSARLAPEADPIWDERITLARTRGMEPHVEPTIARWFTPDFVGRHPEVVDPIRAMIRGTDPAGYIACIEAIRRVDLLESLAEIHVPTLVIAGQNDPGLSDAGAIQARIPASTLCVIPSAAHLCCVEQAETFNGQLAEFLDRLTGNRQQL
jgi:3-oxoadipate enol-lactonase